MEPPKIEENTSDDEIYFGKLTIKEIKKMLCFGHGSKKKYDNISKNDLDTNLRLIETHSQPNLRSNIEDSPVISSPIRPPASDESFIQLQSMESKLCTSPKKSPEKQTPLKEVKVTEDTNCKASPNYYTPAKSVMKVSLPTTKLKSVYKSMEPPIEENTSDDEIYFGKLTIKEIKKMLCFGHGSKKKYDNISKNDLDTNLRLIETHSQPNLRSNIEDSPVISSPIRPPASDESFIQLQSMESKLCTSPKKSPEKQTPLKEVKVTEDTNCKASPNYYTPAKSVMKVSLPTTKLKSVYKSMEPPIEENTSDDEIYFGKLTIKEIKKMLSFGHGSKKKYEDISKNDLDTNLRLIETHSQPNLRSNIEDSPVISSPIRPPASDESFIQLQSMESKLCTSPKKSPEKQTPLKEVKVTEDTNCKASPNYYTPAKSVMKRPFNGFVTPSSSCITKTPIIKTPANPSSLKKPSTPRGTPVRSNAYQHISSPIASYIMNCPTVPLVKDVHPKKPLPRALSIPKLVRNSSQRKIQINKNKEYVNLPSVAYKSAKTTKVVELPDKDKLPQSRWAKKITSSIPDQQL